MTNQEFREWQQRMGYTNAEAAEALGVSLSGLAQLRTGVSRSRGNPMPIDRRTDLACQALEIFAERAKNDARPT